MTIRTGIGGWTYAPWREGVFYPQGLRQKDELAFASRAVGAIEVNGTFYRLQKPDSFRQWRSETPDGFVFTLKGSRFVTNRKVLASAGEGIANFMRQGLVELGNRLGPICWQLAATKRFEADDVARFLDLLPGEWDGLSLRHAIEVAHESFACAEFTSLARERNVAVVLSDHPERATISEKTADFSYMRLQRMQLACPTGYPPARLAELAGLCRAWGKGGDDVFAFMINGAKERAPAAAMALAEQLEGCR